MPKAASYGQRARRLSRSAAPSRSPEASPATIANRGVAVVIAAARSADDAACRRGQKRRHQRHVAGLLGLRRRALGDPALRFVEREPVAVEEPVHLLDRRDALGAEAAAA